MHQAFGGRAPPNFQIFSELYRPFKVINILRVLLIIVPVGFLYMYIMYM